MRTKKPPLSATNDTQESRERISQRAYELYEARGSFAYKIGCYEAFFLVYCPASLQLIRQVPKPFGLLQNK